VAISTGYWPTIWPAPEAATLTIAAGESRLLLPVRKRQAEDGANPFQPPEMAPLTPSSLVSEGRIERRFSYDPIGERAVYVTDADGGVFGEGVQRFDEIGTEQNHALKRELSIGSDDPLT